MATARGLSVINDQGRIVRRSTIRLGGGGKGDDGLRRFHRHGAVEIRRILTPKLAHCARCSAKCATPIANCSRLHVPLVIKNVQTRAIHKGTGMKGATALTRVAWRGQLWEGCEGWYRRLVGAEGVRLSALKKIRQKSWVGELRHPISLNFQI